MVRYPSQPLAELPAQARPALQQAVEFGLRPEQQRDPFVVQLILAELIQHLVQRTQQLLRKEIVFIARQVQLTT
ncbi:MAG: hypothetical protein ACRDTG_30325 [Pseudonocardiaceae bacterium]